MPTATARPAAAPVVVMGSGGHAAEVCAYLSDAAVPPGTGNLLGCIDDHVAPGAFGGLEVLGDFQHLAELLRQHRGLLAITASADNVLRRMMVVRAEVIGSHKFEWLTLVHPHASVGVGVEIGAGTCAAPGSIITTRSRIGRHCILNVKASISHDVTLGDYVNLNPGVVIAGNVHIGDGCYVGAGATVIDRVRVGAGSVIGAGAVVIEDVPANATVVGVPARITKYHNASWEPTLVTRRA